MKRRQVRFLGRVQGVGFRATTWSIATRFPVSGWVRNEPDGSVLLEIQGEPDALQGCLDQLRKQMDGYIRNEDAVDLDVKLGESGFEIRR